MKSHRRMVVKVGSSSLVDDAGRLSVEKLRRIVHQIVELQQSRQWQVVLVSSGSIAAGVSHLGWRRASITLPEKQAAAAVGQTLLMETYQHLFNECSLAVGQVLLTRADIEDRKRFVHIRNTMLTLMRNGIIPIVNENDTVAVEEIRFGDNDTLASLTALVTEADKLVLLTDIDGLYTADPRARPDAARISDVWEITEDIERLAGGAGSSVGTGGMQTKVAAAKIAVQAGTDVIVTSSRIDQVLLQIAADTAVGTVFHARPEPWRLRQSWLAHGPHPEGVIDIDDGAAHALRTRPSSLLLPGVVWVEGDFQEGAVVELTVRGHVLGKGITNFSARDLQMLLERRQQGERFYNLHEVIHRNDLVLIEGGR
ncbi:glutamate 5-kinase [Alicyclobacillus cycloheptanicus]|uniref:Glutamate 5-kinase n=1 Tax=Alicyclobacillus cycloheptanicus TaxID=1457 RepID=A0ABT9XFD0_9BACL|nr:glutamate 5-kinase [Alicyclobacillus cycloheptanicus]MDQ0188779.1 glutamate 5-kinase [Alicyclobacillus cycloheptanicus]WDM00564.1 glutamate 5-kinase [Alicyclobacillus cycloheptanicus]